jgi:predicted nucleic acid-binding protein
LGLIDQLDAGPIGIDTAVFIYFIERHPRYLPVIEPLFEAADRGKRTLVTSAVTLLEVLVKPLRVGDAKLAARYEAILTNSRGVQLLDISRDLLRVAAQLRATLSVKTPDAIQIAAAKNAGCAAFVTNDLRLPAIPGLRIVELQGFIQP